MYKIIAVTINIPAVAPNFLKRVELRQYQPTKYNQPLVPSILCSINDFHMS